MHNQKTMTSTLDLESIERRLAELRELHECGAISESEHHAARAAAFATV